MSLPSDLPDRPVSTRALLDLGYGAGEIRRATQTGRLIRLDRGRYLPAIGQVATVDRQDRAIELYRQRVRAAAEASPDLIVSHASAAAVLGLPLWNVDLTAVHFTRYGRPFATNGRVVHSGRVTDPEVLTLDGLRLTTPARTVVDVGRTLPFESAVIAADHALHTGLALPAPVAEAIEAARRVPGVASARRALLFADGRAESPGESRTRVLLHRQGFPAPDLQIEVYDVDGVLLGRGDLGWIAEAALVEFDGRRKYLRPYRTGMTAADVVMAERSREVILTRTGAGIARVVWAELADPRSVVHNVNQARAIGRRSVELSLLSCTFQPRPPIRVPR